MSYSDKVIHPDLWPAIKDQLCSKYQIITEINFFELGRDPQLMYRQLEETYKTSYAPDEKIIVYHYDTDYYLGNVGFTLYNFLQCLKVLNISPSVIIMFTNHYGIEHEIKTFYSTYYSSFEYDLDRMLIVENNYIRGQSTPTPAATELDIDKIYKPFSCMFGNKRSHRVIFHSLLAQRNILDKGICSWNFTSSIVTPRQADLTGTVDSTKNKFTPEFLTTVPFTNINENWAPNPELSESWQQQGHRYDHPYRHPDLSAPAVDYFTQPAVKKALLHIVCETVFQYPYPYFTEKTFRPILEKRPFLVLGAPGILKLLRSMGFKTFDLFWDESYDSITDPSQRMVAIANIIENITCKTVAQQQELCYSMKQILEYNYQHYVEHYAGSELAQKLKLFYD
jgi:hypothetical protein